jgi:hypothetical protein
MSKFNTTLQKPKKSINIAGGESYNQSKKIELVSILLTSFVNDQFYRSSNDTLVRLKELIREVDPLFAAKAALFARDKFGMRSISHVLASEIAHNLGGKEWAKSFYDKIVVRLDDMTEIVSYYLNNNTDKINPKFPNSMKKGFASAFDRYNEYHLAKYRGENKEVKLVDIVNLVHPIPTESNAEALKSLINGTLRNLDTWESKLSKAGQSEDGDVNQLKSEAWKDLIESKKLGYFAALRNIKNILNQSPEQIDNLCSILTNEKMIQSSRVMPFRFDTAYNEIKSLGSSKDVRKCLVAIDQALNISTCNVPKLDGETLVVIDSSSSMKSRPSRTGLLGSTNIPDSMKEKPYQIASLFGAILAKSNMCDVMTFDRDARYVNYNPNDSVLTIKDSFVFTGGATNFHAIFESANKAYDNIIILSDCQGWVGKTTPTEAFKNYKSRFNCNPYIYSWDLAGYGSLQFPENNVFCLAGFSEKVFDLMSALKEDKRALINEIKSISL